jgi:hypothetical protein
MFMSRFLRSTFLLAAARTEASATAAAASADVVRKARNPLEELFEVERRTDDEKPVIYGITYLCHYFTLFRKGNNCTFSKTSFNDL